MNNLCAMFEIKTLLTGLVEHLLPHCSPRMHGETCKASPDSVSTMLPQTHNPKANSTSFLRVCPLADDCRMKKVTSPAPASCTTPSRAHPWAQGDPNELFVMRSSSTHTKSKEGSGSR